MARYLGIAVVLGLVALMVFAPAAGRHQAPADVMVRRVAGLREVTIPTYEGSGQAMHPDILQDAPLIGGWEYRMSFTPYPNEAESTENASVVVSHDGIRWQVEPGVVNPVSAQFAGLKANSDPDYVYDAVARRCVLLYRSTLTDRPVEHVYAITSPDCRTWSMPVLLFEGPRFTLISPAVVARGDGAPARLWTVDASAGEGCGGRASRVVMRQWVGAPGQALLEGKWTPPMATDLALPGRVVWHLDVVWSQELKEYWALFPAFRPGDGCSNSDLFTAHSVDGIHWTVLPQPLVSRTDTTWTARTLYRSTATFLPGQRMRVWFSSKGSDGRWRTGETVFQIARGPSAERGLLGSRGDGSPRSKLWR